MLEKFVGEILTYATVSNGKNNGQASDMKDHFQSLVRQIKIKLAEKSEQERQFKLPVYAY